MPRGDSSAPVLVRVMFSFDRMSTPGDAFMSVDGELHERIWVYFAVSEVVTHLMAERFVLDEGAN